MKRLRMGDPKEVCTAGENELMGDCKARKKGTDDESKQRERKE